MNVLNISIDDVSPHPLSSVSVLERCFEIIDKFPTIKFTLFVPAAYWRTIGATSTEEPLWINRYPDFCSVLRQLPSKNFELGYHGLLHGIPNVSNNDELQSVHFRM